MTLKQKVLYSVRVVPFIVVVMMGWQWERWERALGLVSSSADVPCMKSLLASHRDSGGKDVCECALDCKMQVTRSPVKKDAHIQDRKFECSLFILLRPSRRNSFCVFVIMMICLGWFAERNMVPYLVNIWYSVIQPPASLTMLRVFLHTYLILASF